MRKIRCKIGMLVDIFQKRSEVRDVIAGTSHVHRKLCGFELKSSGSMIGFILTISRDLQIRK